MSSTTDPALPDAPPTEPTKTPDKAPASELVKPVASRPKPKQPLLPHPREHDPASNL